MNFVLSIKKVYKQTYEKKRSVLIVQKDRHTIQYIYTKRSFIESGKLEGQNSRLERERKSAQSECNLKCYIQYTIVILKGKNYIQTDIQVHAYDTKHTELKYSNHKRMSPVPLLHNWQQRQWSHSRLLGHPSSGSCPTPLCTPASTPYVTGSGGGGRRRSSSREGEGGGGGGALGGALVVEAESLRDLSFVERGAVIGLNFG